MENPASDGYSIGILQAPFQLTLPIKLHNHPSSPHFGLIPLLFSSPEVLLPVPGRTVLSAILLGAVFLLRRCVQVFGDHFGNTDAA